jgi:hypothetical protein
LSLVSEGAGMVTGAGFFGFDVASVPVSSLGCGACWLIYFV